MAVIGIDPGLDGGIGWLGEEPGAVVMPILAGRPDLHELRSILREFGSFVVIEEPCGMPGQSSVATFTTARNYGMIVGALTAWGIPFQEVRPNLWKKKMGLEKVKDETVKERKGRAIQLASQLFPSVELKATPSCKTYHDGMAEALLIAEYGRRELKQ